MGKWGSLNIPHSLVFDTHPRNITESDGPSIVGAPPEFQAGIMPVTTDKELLVPKDTDNGYWENSLVYYNNFPCMLTGEGLYSSITYGKAGFRRGGSTKIMGMTVSTGPSSEGITALDCSFDNVGANYGELWTEPTQNYRVRNSFKGNTTDIPLLSVGRWFTVTIQGDFSLTQLVLYGQPEGKLRFRPNPS